MKKLLLVLFPFAAFAQNNDTVPNDSLRVLLKDEVLVTATRVRENSAATYTNDSKEELQRNNLGQDVPYLLMNTPSLVTTSDAGAGVGYTGMRIRGSDQSRINVTINGVPINEAETQDVYWVDMPDLATSIGSVQIQRGVGTSTNGGGAFGASVNVKTNGVSQKAFGQVDASYGSFNTAKIAAQLNSGLIKNMFSIEGRGSFITSDGYVDRGSSKLWSYYLGAHFQHKGTLIKLINFGGGEKTYQAWYGVPQDSLATNRTLNIAGTDYFSHLPAYDNQIDNYQKYYTQLFIAQQLPKHFLLNVGLFVTTGKGYYEEFKTDQSLEKYGIAPQLVNGDSLFRSDVIRRRWLDNVYMGGTVSLAYEHKGFNATLGGLASYYDGKHFGRAIWGRDVANFDPNHNYYFSIGRKQDMNTFLKLSYDFRFGLNVFVDGQYRYVHHEMRGNNNDLIDFDEARTFHFFNPKVGVAQRIGEQHLLYVSFAMANREPARDDIIDAKIDKHEQLQDLEAGYNFRHRKFPLGINGFWMNYKDQLVLTGKLNDVGGPIRTNVPNSFRAGVELNGEFNFYGKKKGVPPAGTGMVNALLTTQQRKVFSIIYNFTYSVNKVKAFDEYIYTYDDYYSPIDSLTLVVAHSNSDISFSPNIVAYLELVAYPLKGLEISLSNKFVGKQYLDNTQNEARKLRPYFFSNLRVSYALTTSLMKEVRFTVMVNNLFHRLYETNGYTYSERYAYDDGSGTLQTTDPATYNYFYPQAGVNVMGGISVRF